MAEDISIRGELSYRTREELDAALRAYGSAETIDESCVRVKDLEVSDRAISVKLEMPIPMSSPRFRFSACSRLSSA